MFPILFFWEAGSFPVIIGDVAKDIYGASIMVGSKVKLVGTVTAVNLNDTHFGDIQVMPDHPGASGPFIPDLGGIPQSLNFGVGDPATAAGPYGFHPSQLIVGV